MSQLGARNPTAAWTRAPGAAGATAQQLNPSIFSGQMAGLASPFMLPSAASLGLGAAGLSAAAFSQPNAALNMMQQAQQVAARAALQQQKNQRTFVGFVTKMQDNYGFVDDDVFFQVNVVRGAMPRIGDRVMVEANYNPSMPFKWNAFRIQLIPPQENQNAVPIAAAAPAPTSQHSQRWAPQNAQTTQMPQSNLHSSSASDPRRARSPPPPRRRSPPPPRRRSPTPPRREEIRREPPPKRERERSPQKRERVSPKREEKERSSASPPRRRARIIPRYAVYLPKLSLAVDGIQSGMQLRKRYNNLYIPGDFFEMRPSWMSSITLDHPVRMHTSAVFHVLDKIIDRPTNVETAILEPSDADSRWQAKVLLLSQPGLDAIRLKAYGLGSDASLDETVDPLPLSRVLSFLVGVRGKGETMAIGGSWSPSLDGQNPDTNPQTLIRTAIRTTMALTGIDLSGCTRWYTMVQLRYHRSDKQRTDTVRLLLPDPSALMPDVNTFEGIQASLRSQLSDKLAQLEHHPTPVVNVNPSVEPVAKPSSQQEGQDVSMDVAIKTEPEVSMKSESMDSITPTPWTKLDIKAMKVAELKRELEARQMDSKGIKAVLAGRLQEAIDAERANADDVEEVPGDASKIADAEPMETDTIGEDDENVADTTIDKSETETASQTGDATVEKHEKDVKDVKDKKAHLERHFNIPKEPGILVYPSRTAKGGKFECKVMSMASLLDYRAEDSKENSFEVSVFVEAFNEMLDRAHAFRLYAALSQAVDRETEKKRREEIQKSRENSTAAGEASNVANSITGAAQTDKCVIGDAEAFAAFAYFDQNLCGHLMERDVEEIVSATALGLTRSQIQKVLKKNSARDKINYRLITDHILDKDTGELKYAPTPLADAPTLAQLAIGNLGEHSEGSMMPTTAESDLVLYKGSLFNIAHSLEQSVKLDSERLIAVQRVDALETQLKSVKDAKEVVEKKKRRLEDDLDRYKKRLHDAEKCLKNSQDDTVQIRTAMQECKKMGEKITHLVDKVMPNKEKQQRAKKETSVSAQTKKTEDQSSSTPIVPSTAETGTKENEMDSVKDQQSTETTANGGETMVIPEEENKEELDLKLDVAEE